MIFITNAFYIIGGEELSHLGPYPKRSNIIGRLDAATKVWSKAGTLITPRKEHSVIFDGSNLMIIGGWYEKMTEKCSISNKQITCFEQFPMLNDYDGYPALFLVPSDFCVTF